MAGRIGGLAALLLLAMTALGISQGGGDAASSYPHGDGTPAAPVTLRVRSGQSTSGPAENAESVLLRLRPSDSPVAPAVMFDQTTVQEQGPTSPPAGEPRPLPALTAPPIAGQNCPALRPSREAGACVVFPSQLPEPPGEAFVSGPEDPAPQELAQSPTTTQANEPPPSPWVPAVVRILHASYQPQADRESAAPSKDGALTPQGDKGDNLVAAGSPGASVPEEPLLLQALEWRPESRSAVGRCERIPLVPCEADGLLAASLPAEEPNGPQPESQRAVQVTLVQARSATAAKPTPDARPAEARHLGPSPKTESTETARTTVALMPGAVLPQEPPAIAKQPPERAAPASEAGSEPAAGLPAPEGAETIQLGPFEVIDRAEGFNVALRRSKLLRTEVDIDRSVVADPTVCHLVPLTPREISVVGKRIGATHVTFSFAGNAQRPVTYLVRVTPDPDEQHQREQQRAAMERHLGDLFPQSQVRLAVAGDLWLVKGQARDANECAQILEAARVLVAGGFRANGPEGTADQGPHGTPPGHEENPRRVPPIQVVNMLRIASAR